jgi:hypothetical protein
MSTKYQIFVSSTYEDLKTERDRVIQGILEMGHIPVGMEMFSAADEEQWQIIARHIEESDYYVVIVAHRYGSLDGGISFTRKEYEHAIRSGVPVIGFVIDPEASWPADRVDTAARATEGLKSFKQLVEKKPVGYWTNADDLYGKSSVALVKAMSAQPRIGWIRASSAVGPEVTAEISRLSAENAALRERLTELAADSEREHEAELDALWTRLRRTEWSYAVRISYGGEWVDAKSLRMSTLFNVLAPSLVIESDRSAIDRLLKVHSSAVEDEDAEVLSIPSNRQSALLADFMTLDLMEPSARRHAVSDRAEYWTLTETGRELMKRRKLVILEKSWDEPVVGAAAADGDTDS